MQGAATYTLEQFPESKNYWKVGFQKYRRSKKWLYANPHHVFERVFNNFKLYQGVFGENTPPDVEKIYEKLIAKYP